MNNVNSSDPFGTTLYVYHTWTNWCWNRTSHVISNVTTNFYISDVQQSWSWQGQTSQNIHFYTFSDGNSLSGYYHERVGHFEQCLAFICTNHYPDNILRSHANGTWTWDTADG